MKVILIRHGETVWQKEGRYQGLSDVPLSKEGRQKLKAAKGLPSAESSGQLSGRLLPAPEIVYTTGLLRTDETARILFPGAVIARAYGLEEMHFGDFEGKNFEELKDCKAYRSWVEGGCLGACPGGEGRDAFIRRICTSFDALMASHAARCGRKTADGEPGREPSEEPLEAPLVLVCHAGTIMALLSAYGAPRRDYFDWHCGCGEGFLLSAKDWPEERILTLLSVVRFTADESGTAGPRTGKTMT